MLSVWIALHSLNASTTMADTGPRGVFVSPTTGVSVGTVWGVFVGVSQYQNQSLNLAYADRDAHSLYVFFSEHFTGKISPDHFRLLINEQATRGRVLQTLSETLRLAQPEDLVIISLAMHGLPDPAGNDLYFLAHDTDPNYPEDRAISQYDLIRQIQRSKVRKIVLMLDACHAGTFGTSASIMRGANTAEVNRMLTTLGQVQDGIAVLTSSSAAEQSQEGMQFCGGHGAFTCALVEGLKGKADSDRNGLIQIRELFDYAYREVKQLTKGSQHPAIEGRYDNGLPLATTLSLDDEKMVGLSKKDVKYTDYEGLRAKAEYQAKLERAWSAVDGIAKMQELPADSRISTVTQFLQEFSEDNRHRAEADKIVEQIREEAKQREVEAKKQADSKQRELERQKQVEAKQRELELQKQAEAKQRELEAQRQAELKQREIELQKQAEARQRELEVKKQAEATRAQASPPPPATMKPPVGKEMMPVEVAKAPAYGAGQDQDANLARQITGADGAPMVLIPSGEFIMGSTAAADERPAHRVLLDSYYIDIYEVTYAQYAKYLNAVSGQPSPHQWNTVNLSEDGNRPVIGVNWSEADGYCRWAEKRLPTEAEWEKAARGTDGRKYPWGDEEPREGLANFGRCCGWSGFGLLAPVGTNQAGKSPYGVFDLMGNVWEWVADWYDGQYYKNSPEKNPKGPTAGREKVMRGGSWSNRAVDLRASLRDKVAPTYRNYSIGFRCASNVKG